MDPNHPVFEFVPPARKAFLLPALALSSILAEDKRHVYASADRMYRYAYFGRDTVEVTEDIMQWRPRLARNLLVGLCGYIGTGDNPASEEEPGKAIHEYRSTTVNNK